MISRIYDSTAVAQSESAIYSGVSPHSRLKNAVHRASHLRVVLCTTEVSIRYKQVLCISYSYWYCSTASTNEYEYHSLPGMTFSERQHSTPKLRKPVLRPRDHGLDYGFNARTTTPLYCCVRQRLVLGMTPWANHLLFTYIKTDIKQRKQTQTSSAANFPFRLAPALSPSSSRRDKNEPIAVDNWMYPRRACDLR